MIDHGHEASRRLEADEATRNIPVIFATARNDAAEKSRGLEVGAVDFIAKPANPAVLRVRVKTNITLKQQSDLLRQMVFIDGLTGNSNRCRFDEVPYAEGRRSSRTGLPLARLMLDVDHFKRYNDRYGHQAGDDCLRRVVRIVTITVGVSVGSAGRQADPVRPLALADAQLYRAKHSGRGRACGDVMAAAE